MSKYYSDSDIDKLNASISTKLNSTVNTLANIPSNVKTQVFTKDNTFELSPNKVIVSSSDGKLSTSDTNSTKLNYLDNLTSDLQQQINDQNNNTYILSQKLEDIARTMRDESLEYKTNNLDKAFNNKLSTITLDDFIKGSNKKIIENNVYNGSTLTINGTLSAPKITFMGIVDPTRPRVKYITENNFETEILTVFNEDYTKPSLKISRLNNSSNNIIELNSGISDSNKFTMTSEGRIGIGTTLPSVSLDIIGDINITGKLNSVSKDEIMHMSGLSDNIVAQINFIKESIVDNSNIAIGVAISSNEKLLNYVKISSNNMYSIVDNNKLEASNYINTAYDSLSLNKMEKITFGQGLSYNSETNELFLETFKDLWNYSEDYLSYSNIRISDGNIQVVNYDIVNDDVLIYPPLGTIGLDSVSGTGTKSVTSSAYADGDYTISWSSTKTYPNGDPYSTPLHWFDNNVSSYGFLTDDTYTYGLYNGVNKINNDYLGEWVKIKMPDNIYIRVSYIVLKHRTDYLFSSPTDFKIYGSNNNQKWEELYHGKDIEYSTTGSYTSFKFNSLNSYNYIAICVNKIGISESSTYLMISSFEIYGKQVNTILQNEYAMESAISGKFDKMTGAVTSILNNNLTPNKLLGSDSNGKITTLNFTEAHLANISGLRSNIQVQLNEIVDIIPTSNTSIETINVIDGNISNYILSSSNNLINLFNGKQNTITFGNGLSYNAATDILSIIEVEKSDPVSFMWSTSNHTTSNEIYYEDIVVDHSTIYINKKNAITIAELPKKQDVINFTSEIGINTTTNMVSILNKIWEDTGSNIKYENVSIYDNKVVVGENISGYVLVDNIMTDNLLHMGNKISIGNNVELYKNATATSVISNKLFDNNGVVASSSSNLYSMRIKKDLWLDGANINWTSDIRIKKNVTDIDDNSALQKILEIEPKIYNYIDNDNISNVYGFISQQIENVFPQATKKTTKIIPNIYDTFDYDNSSGFITFPDNFDISKLNILQNDTYSSNLILDEQGNSNIIVTNNNHISDKIRISFDKDVMNYIDITYSWSNREIIQEFGENGESSNVTKYGIYIDDNIFWKDCSNVFVYGSEVYDLTTIDKSYIYTINTCATQELNRKIEMLYSDNITLDEYIKSLENRIAVVNAYVSSNL